MRSAHILRRLSRIIMAPSRLFLGNGDFVQPDRRRIHPGRQRKARVDADIRIFRLEVFLHKQFQNELGNFDAIEGNRIHVNQSLSLRAVGVGRDHHVMQSAEDR